MTSVTNVETAKASFVEEPADFLVLLAQAEAGDAEAFCELSQSYQGRLFRQAIALCGNAVLAQDLAQETLIAAWKSLRRYHRRCRFFTWLCSILLHQHYNSRRKKAPVSFSSMISGAGEDAERLLYDLAEGGLAPDLLLEAGEREAILRRCLQRLPEKHRQVVHLRFYVDESLESIAVALECSVGTIKSRLFHALDKLAHMPELKHLSTEALL